MDCTTFAHVELAKRASDFLSNYYQGESDLAAMNGSAVEIPIDIYMRGDVDYFIGMSDDDIHDEEFTAQIEFGITSVLMVPRHFFDCKHETQWTAGIQLVLSHLGMPDVWSLEEINKYVHGNCPWNEFNKGWIDIALRAMNTWSTVLALSDLNKRKRNELEEKNGIGRSVTPRHHL